MVPYYILVVILILATVKGELIPNGDNCSNFQANFELKDVIGTWHVVAIIPTKIFPEKPLPCYKVEISETEEAGLKWLINKTVEAPGTILLNNTGVIILQRYHTDVSFDVWSKSISGIQGCFQEIFALDGGKSNISLQHGPMMQLHFVEIQDGEPFLLQMLWGKMVSTVMYRRTQGVTKTELKQIYDLVNLLRGPQLLPRICDVTEY